ncbi:MATE family efflux transporter [Prosthecomicrobium sp. N25]|uniref:MATE family efflux transporter n=1 Tax=Prosthecomicrobium sp. N25 TaxID=3129254 RepID=UPI00307773A3
MQDPSPIRPPGHRDVLAIAIPMTLGYMTTPLVGLVDMGVVGRLGDPALIGGVAVGSVICDVVFTTFNFLRSGTTGLTAQAVGRGDRAEIDAALLRALVLAAATGLVTMLAAPLAVSAGTRVFGGSAAVQEAMSTYVLIRLLGAPLVLTNFAIFGWLLGLGRAGAGLLLQTILNGVNMAAAVALVIGAGWGVAGAAVAAVLADAVALAAGLILVGAIRRPRRPWPERRAVFERQALTAMLAMNRDIMIRSFVLLAAFAFFTRQSAAQGDVVLAANAILEKFFLFGGYFLDGFAAAAETFVGRAVGARRRAVYDRAIALTTMWGFVLALAVATGLYTAGPGLVALMTTSEPVRATALAYLVWAALTPLAGVLAFQMDGVFIGATWSRDMRNMMLLSLLVYLAAWALLTPAFGNDGLWVALLVFLGCRGLSLGWISLRRARETFGAAAAP